MNNKASIFTKHCCIVMELTKRERLKRKRRGRKKLVNEKCQVYWQWSRTHLKFTIIRYLKNGRSKRSRNQKKQPWQIGIVTILQFTKIWGSCPEVFLVKVILKTSMLKCDFNKISKQLYWNHTSAWVLSVNLLHISRTPFYQNACGGLLLSNNFNFCQGDLIISDNREQKM